MNNLLIGKICGGCCVVGTATGTSIYYKKEIAAFFSQKNSQELIELTNDAKDNSYLVVSATAQENSVDLISGKNQNYNCLIKDETTNIGCEIISISFVNNTKRTDLTSLNSQKIDRNVSTTIEKGKINTENFKLKLNKTDLDKITDLSSKTIDIVSLGNAQKTLATLTPQLKVIDGKVTLQEPKLLAITKASSTHSDTSSPLTNYKCTMDTEITTPIECQIYKFTTPIDSSTQIDSIDFQTNTLSLGQQHTDITDNKLHVVSLAKQDKTQSIETWKAKTISFKAYSSGSTTEESNKKSYTFTVSGRLFGDISNNTKGFIVLEK